MRLIKLNRRLFMYKEVRFSKDDKVEILDSKSSYIGKTGTVVNVKEIPMSLFSKGPPKMQIRLLVKLDDTGDKETFTLSQVKKVM